MSAPKERFETIEVADQMIFAGGHGGAYKTVAGTDDWGFLGLDIDSAYVKDFVAWDDHEILAAMNFDSLNYVDPALWKSNNGGQTWAASTAQWPETDNPFRALDIEQDPRAPNRLVAILGSIYQSTDKGQSWEFLLNQETIATNHRFISTNPFFPDIIFGGGGNSFLMPAVFGSFDNGQTWDSFLIGGEGVVQDMVFHPTKSNRMLAGTYGAFNFQVIGTYDKGESWDILNENYGIFAFAQSPQDGRLVYAAGVNKNSTLSFLVSSDFGKHWQQITHPEGIDKIFTNDLAVIQDGEADVLFFATNRGVFRYKFENIIE